MASPLNITRIPAPRVPFLDERTGQISREWYRFLYNIFLLTGEGNNAVTLDELQIGPPNNDQFALDAKNVAEAQTNDSPLLSSVAELAKQVQAAELSAEAAMNQLEAQIMGLANGIHGLSSQPPQNPQVLWSNVLNQPKLEAYDTSASIPLTTTPTLLKPALTIANPNGITYDAATGVFVFSNAGSYNLSLNVNAVASASNQFVYIYAEQDVGAGWAVNTNSGKTYELSNANMVQIVYSQAVARVAGQKVRYYIYSNDVKVSLQTYSLPGGVGAIVPAIRVQYS